MFEGAMQTKLMPPILMIMLCMRCRLGGAEKRYARVFEMLVAQPGVSHKLLINRSMLNLLQTAGILTRHESFLVVLDPPFRQHLPPQCPAWMLRILRPLAWLLDALWYTWQCWQMIRQYRPDIVHPLLTGVYFSVPALFFHPRTHYMMSAYSYQFESYRDKRILGISLGAAIKRLALQHCHSVDALSKSIRDDLIARGINSAKIQVAPCSFTDISLCQPASHKHRWIVFLGRFVDIKRPLLLIQAIPKIVAQVPDVHFYFLGEGYLQPKMERLIHKWGITDYVTMRFESNPTQILNWSSIFVSLQTEENYPSQSLLEAMACANAVVATDAGETWRLVDNVNGIRISPTVDAVAEAIVKLLRDPILTQRGVASRQRVLTEHTLECFFTYITNLYRTTVRTFLP